MQTNPFTRSLLHRLTGIFLLLLAGCLQGGILVWYQIVPAETACMDSLIYVAFFAIAGYLLWYTVGFLKAFQAQMALALLIQGVCLAGQLGILALLDLESVRVFAKTLPLRVVCGLLAWTILYQWYYLQYIQLSDMETEELPRPDPQEEVQMATITPEIIDHITVKDGARIHILPLDEILYIQAAGDYVTLYTPTGEHIKEQTMKYFEQQLDSLGFVRIHRSCIVNTRQIIRVELFGKETYQVRLKNNISLRCSASGYKLLKVRLSL